MERSQLQYVVEVAKWQNITRAAEVLHLSQPSLSNQILNLERELGVSLFERTRKRVYLTEAGESFVYQAKQILNGMSNLKESMTDYAQRRAGKIRVGALSVMVPLGIPDILTAFSSQYPTLEITLIEDGSNALVDRVRMNEVDVAFAILSDIGQEDDLYQIKLMGSDIVAVVNTSHPLAGREALTLEDLRDERLVIATGNFNMQRLLLGPLAERGIPFQISAMCDQIETCFQLVDRGFGISYCSGSTSQYYHYEHVRYLSLPELPARFVYLLYKKNPAYYPALQVFVTFVKDWYR